MYPDYKFLDAVARKILADYAFTATDLPDEDRVRVARWVMDYPSQIATAQRPFAQALFSLLATHNLDTANVAAGLIDAAVDAAHILEAQRRRQREADAPGPRPDPAFISWLDRKLAEGKPAEEQPVPGKHALPAMLYFRLKQEAAAAGLPPPQLYVSRREEDQCLLRLIIEVKNAELFWRARLKSPPAA